MNYPKKHHSTPRRVLHIVSSMARGGLENWLMSLLRKTDRRILEVDFCALKGEKGDFAKEIESLDSKIIPCSIRPLRTLNKRLGNIIKAGHYDVVHSHGWSFSGWVLRIAHHYGAPVRVAHSHTTRSLHTPSCYRSIYTWCMQHLILKHATDCLGCATEAMAPLFGANWRKSDKCRVLYCSIDVDPFAPDHSYKINKSHFGLQPDAVVIGNVGNIRTPKNHTFFLDIAAELIHLKPKAHFLIIGDGPLKEQMKNKAKMLKIDDRVIFAGVRSDVPQLLMNVFDAFLFPSLWEGMPLTLIEAAAAGLPVVCSDTITNEATDVIPQLFTRLSLDLPAEKWAAAVNDALEKGRMDREQTYSIVKNSHFSVEYSLRELASIYGCDQKSILCGKTNRREL